jgi:hypothetical protein
MTTDFAAWFAQQLLEACTRQLPSLSSAPSASSLMAATASLSLLVETPLAIPSISGLHTASLFKKHFSLMTSPNSGTASPLSHPSSAATSVPPHAHNLPLPLPPLPRHAPGLLFHRTYFPRSPIPASRHFVQRLCGACDAGWVVVWGSNLLCCLHCNANVIMRHYDLLCFHNVLGNKSCSSLHSLLPEPLPLRSQNSRCSHESPVKLAGW